jgi:UDP-N-acetylmuramate dehydrogenase
MNSLAEKIEYLPQIRGRYTQGAPLGERGWFRCGGVADILFKPADIDDLQDFLVNCPEDIPVSIFGAMSNSIIRDGGIRGVVVRLGREFSSIEIDDTNICAGSLALDANVAKEAARAGIEGLEFFSGIPGTIGGALRMNAGCYGTETKDVLVEATAIDRNGVVRKLSPEDMGMSYRHTKTPEDYIFTGAVFRGSKGDSKKIEARIKEIRDRRENSQPIKEKTGGSTFANPSATELSQAGLPEDTKVWQLIEMAGCRGLKIGGAQMSEKHCNFMINAGGATAADLENLGEEVRARVLEDSGISLRWEIRRVGEKV